MLKLILLAFLKLICISNSQDIVGPPQCPPNYVGDPTANLCYGMQAGAPQNHRTWVEAQKGCKDIGGDLAVLERGPQNVLKWLRTTGLNVKVNTVWVGANDAPQKNSFAWLRGQPVNQKGILKFNDKYPVPHEKPTCIFLEYNKKIEEIYVSNALCAKDKRSFICQMPMYIPGQKNSGKGDGKNYRSGAENEKRGKSKPVVASAAEIAAIMPKVPGAATIVAVSAEKLAGARSGLLTSMYGSALMSQKDMEKLLPRGLLAANISDGALASVKAVLTEMTAEYIHKSHGGNETEIAKTLTAELLDQGRSIRCTYGVNEKQREVECIPVSSGIIDSCMKATSVDGTIVRDCGLPGAKLSGCHTTIQGVVCMCDHDLCNKSSNLVASSWLSLSLLLYRLLQHFLL